MARIEGVDPQKTSFPMRYVFKKIRKMLGRDLTPQKIAARVPRVFWVTTFTEYLLGQKAKVPQRLRSILLLRTAARVSANCGPAASTTPSRNSESPMPGSVSVPSMCK